MKRLFLVVIFLWNLHEVTGQDLDPYQYVVIPSEFDFQKEQDQYQLNELLKFLFEKEGFQAYLDNEPIPPALSSNACKGLRARVKNESGLFRTRLFIELRDCNNRVVFISQEGVSREKDFKQAFHEALRAAFESISQLGYNYQEQENIVEVTALPPAEDVKNVKGEIEKELPAETRNPAEMETKQAPHNIKREIGDLLFQRDGSEFFLEKIPSGYNLYQKGMAEPFATLIKSSAGESYVYSSVTAKGMGSFDEDGNLTIEILDPESNSLKTTVYTKQD